MKKIISKTVLATYPGGFRAWDNEYFEQIRERLWNKDRYRTKEESGIMDDKKTMPGSNFGYSNDRGVSMPGVMGLGRSEEESADRSLSSGYNYDDQDRPVDDETGPGNSKQEANPYLASDLVNTLFMQHYVNKSERDSRPNHTQGFVKKLLDGSPLAEVRPKRWDPDNLQRAAMKKENEHVY